MTAKKRAPAKKAPAKKSLFQRVSDAMNPRTYLEKPAQDTMRRVREDAGAPARRRQIEEITGDGPGARRRRSR
jgi:hypothetical protein